ncbi:MAG: DUF3127 domain-containing protein [Prevotellaceae bacterium]|jgi:hypothetical protein|nr:DUF3127 domain-containing protein [Prevotellaceae bacterium]
MALEVTGKIIQVLDLQSGVSARGDWKKQEFILETEDQYPRKICISLWGDKVSDIASIQLNRDLITVSITLESREFNGRWYTDVRAWKIQHGSHDVQNPGPIAPPVNSTPTQSPVDDYASSEKDPFDDLPF